MKKQPKNKGYILTTPEGIQAHILCQSKPSQETVKALAEIIKFTYNKKPRK